MSSSTPIDWPATKAVFVAWERLRLIYNGLLIPLVLAAVWVTTSSAAPQGGLIEPAPESGWIAWLVWWLVVCTYGFFANLCFLFGPLVENYAGWLGWKTGWLRVGLFVAGTAFTAIGALAFVTATAGPMVDADAF